MLKENSYYLYFSRAAFVLLIIFILNAIAHRLNLYFVFWWYDMLVHFLGGYFIAILFVALSKHSSFSKYSDNWSVTKYIVYTFCTVIVIGVLWEVFEWGLQSFFSITDLLTIPDSFSDLFFDSLGCVVFLFREYYKNGIL